MMNTVIKYSHLPTIQIHQTSIMTTSIIREALQKNVKRSPTYYEYRSALLYYIAQDKAIVSR